MSIALQSVAREVATLELVPDRSLLARHRLAARDVREAGLLWRLCWTLAWLDIKLRYRGSLLGPFWLTLSTAVMVGAMGGIYAALFHMDLHAYLPFLALSLVLWNFLAALVADACQGYTAAEPMIRSVRMPLSLYAARIVLRNVVVLAHNLLVIIVVFAIFAVVPGIGGLLAIPAFALWLIDSLALAVLLGALCARFRDIPPIVGSLLQMAFFVTPIIWKPELVGPSRTWLLPFNPFFSLVEILRDPLMGSLPTWTTLVSAIGYSVLLWGLTWILFARVRARIAFWV